MVDDEKKYQRVKIVGPLFVFKSWLAIIRDLLLIVFLAGAIIGGISLFYLLQDVSQNPVVTALKSGDVSKLLGSSGESAAQALFPALTRIEDSYARGDTTKSLEEVQTLEDLARKMGANNSDLAPLGELRKAIQAHDTATFQTLITQIKSKVSGKN